ncbi:MAG: hypothetical protein LBD13_04260 [Spirochaetaceae bacterium]|jgi:hypothetical protein|nr:hypothetical protein [Spirochaetaceae bacterium]
MKRFKILCTGMAAALSFALMLAGCDSESGGSKKDGPGGGSDVEGKTSPVFEVQNGHNALKITGGAGAGGSFKDGLHVYIKADGKEALITAAAAPPAGYHAPSGTPVFIADAINGAPALWVKNLDAAGTPAADGKLLSGVNQITVKIAEDALNGEIGGLGAVASGTAVVVPITAGAVYKVNNTSPLSGGELKFDGSTAPGTAAYYPTNGAPSGDIGLDPVFDAQLIAVFGGSGGLTDADEAAFNDKGLITSVSLKASTPSAAKINGAITHVGEVTLDADAAIAGGETITVPDNKTLALADAKVITFADSTSSIDVGSTPAGAFKIIGATNATLTSAKTVSFKGLAGGSKISGSANDAKLAVGSADAAITIAGTAAAGAVIESVTVDLEANGMIQIEQSGILTLQGADAVIIVDSAKITLMTSNQGIKDATVGSNITFKADAESGNGIKLGSIIGADTGNTITPSATNPVEIKKEVTND